jgi:hypothetical protein
MTLTLWSHPALPAALAALGDVLVARYRHWRCSCCGLFVLIVLRSKDAVAAHVPYRNSKLTHMLQVVVGMVVVVVVMMVVVMVLLLICGAVRAALHNHADTKHYHVCISKADARRSPLLKTKTAKSSFWPTSLPRPPMSLRRLPPPLPPALLHLLQRA